MSTTSRAGRADTRRDAHPAELFDRIVGPVLILVGLLGFIASSSFDTGSPSGENLIIFKVNGWHNLVHIASGLLLVAGIGQWRRARTVTLIFGLTYAVVTLIGFIDGSDILGLLPVDTEDNILHLVLAIGAIAAALAPAPDGALDDRLQRTSPGRATGEERFGRDGAVERPTERDRQV